MLKILLEKACYTKTWTCSHLCYSDSRYVDDKRDRKSTTGYCTFVEENFVTRRSMKQDVISRSSV